MLLLDQTSLLLAIGFSALALAVTLFVAWLSARSEAFLLNWSMGMCVLVMGVVSYGLFTAFGPEVEPLGMLAFVFLAAGFVLVYGAAIHFHTGTMPRRLVAALMVGIVACVSLCFGLGVGALGAAVANLFVAVMLVLTGLEYWRCRDEAPVSISTIALLYGATALSFVPCGVLMFGQPGLALPHAPSNWAETLNSVVCVVGITGIGALSLALNQARLARRHRNDAMTDALTGLVNRRAVFERHDQEPLAARTAVIVFDLDAFKGVNDDYGHAVGDLVLQRFAGAIRETMRGIDTGARLGGEEFVLVMPRATPDLAVLTAERIRALFESEVIVTERGSLSCTVSAGVAFAAEAGEGFSALLRRADNALYLAKRGGRNRVMSPGLKLVA